MAASGSLHRDSRGDTRASYRVAERMQPTMAPLGPVAFSGFPVRSLTGRVHGVASEGGEWITAYQTEQRKRLRAVLASSVRETRSAWDTKPPANTREASGVRRKILDREFLLRHCFVEAPMDLCVCSICGLGLRDYRSEDFALFGSVVSVDASDNLLPLEAFKAFPILEHLELSLNGITDVTLELGDFPSLQFLDLSYNTLSGLALLALGTLPSLKELYLTGNNIVALPMEMSRPHSTAQQDRYGVRFPVLERLWLDDNKLSDQTTFATLAGLRKLKYLNLDNNEMYTIPQLKLIGTSPLKTTNTGTEHTESSTIPETPPPIAESREGETDLDAERERGTGELTTTDTEPSQSHAVELNTFSMVQSPLRPPTPPNSVDPHTSTRHAPPATPKYSINSQTQLSTGPAEVESRDGTATPVVMTHGQASHAPGQLTSVSRESEYSTPPLGNLPPAPSSSLAPFPCLQTLSLVNNLILSAEGLVACGSWPSLRELVVHGNPLMRSTRGVPPLVQSQLVQQRNIKVIRHRPVSVKKHFVGEAAKDFKKVSTAPPPTIPKYPLSLRAPPSSTPHILRHLPPSPHHHHDPSHSPPPSLYSSSSSSSSLESQSSTSSSSSKAKSRTVQERSGDQGKGNSEQQGVFLTQGTEEPTELSQRARSPPSQAAALSPQQPSVQDKFKAWRKGLRERHRDIPDRYRGYEALLDSYDDPSMPIPTDMHGCTRALQYALKHPLVIADPTTAVSSTPHTPTGKYLKRKPSATTPPQTQPSAKIRDVQMVLDDIKTHCVSLDRNIGGLLCQQSPPLARMTGKSSAQLRRESQLLLAEMQARYDRVRASSLKMLRSVTTLSANSRSLPMPPAGSGQSRSRSLSSGGGTWPARSRSVTTDSCRH